MFTQRVVQWGALIALTCRVTTMPIKKKKSTEKEENLKKKSTTEAAIHIEPLAFGPFINM